MRKETTKMHDLLILSNNLIFDSVLGLMTTNYYKAKSNEIERLRCKAFSLVPAYETLDECYAYLVFNLNCNFRCIYCFETNSRTTSSALNISECISVIKALTKLYSKVNIILYGGEPLLMQNTRIIQNLLRSCEELSVHIRVITNGYYLDAFKKLFQKYDYIDSITITLDGPEIIHNIRRPLHNGKGTYQKIVDNILILNSSLHTNLRINLDFENLEYQHDWLQENKEILFNNVDNIYYYRTQDISGNLALDKLLTLDQFANFMDELEINENYGLPIKSGDNTYNHIKSILESQELIYPRYSYCEFGYIYVLMNDGNIYTCPEVAMNESYKLCTMKAFINSPERYSVLQKHNVRNIEYDNECAICSVNMLCGGGCSVAFEFNTHCHRNEIIKTIMDMIYRRNENTNLPSLHIYDL